MGGFDDISWFVGFRNMALSLDVKLDWERGMRTQMGSMLGSAYLWKLPCRFPTTKFYLFVKTGY